MSSPLDVAGVDLGVTTDEIVACVREARRFGDSVDGAGFGGGLGGD